jgi:hypothetical protein
MTPYELYREYAALKRHFSEWKYDYFKFHGKLKGISPASFEMRKDIWAFEKLARDPDPLGTIIANLVIDEKCWIGDIAQGEVSLDRYENRRRVLEQITYYFREDLTKLNPNLDINFRLEPNDHPLIIKRYLGGHVALETMAILVDYTQCAETWKNSGDPLIDKMALRATRYLPFINFDRDYMVDIIKAEYD